MFSCALGFPLAVALVTGHAGRMGGHVSHSCVSEARCCHLQPRRQPCIPAVHPHSAVLHAHARALAAPAAHHEAHPAEHSARYGRPQLPDFPLLPKCRAVCLKMIVKVLLISVISQEAGSTKAQSVDRAAFCKTLGKSLVVPLLSGPLCRNSYIPPPL